MSNLIWRAAWLKPRHPGMFPTRVDARDEYLSWWDGHQWTVKGVPCGIQAREFLALEDTPTQQLPT